MRANDTNVVTPNEREALRLIAASQSRMNVVLEEWDHNRPNSAASRRAAQLAKHQISAAVVHSNLAVAEALRALREPLAASGPVDFSGHTP